MYRLPGERIPLDLGGPTVEVEPVRSWMIQFEGTQLLGRYMAAEKPEAEYAALSTLYEYFVPEAQPSWDLVDHRGPIPTTARGMARLPADLGPLIVARWLETLAAAEQEEPEERPEIPGLRLVESKAPTAVDAVIPPGPLNREIKRRLRQKKAA